jgi:hypothetical protein
MIEVDLNATRPYSLKRDKDTPPTIFHLGYLDPEMEALINDRTTRYEVNSKGKEAQADAIVSSDQRSIDIVRFGLKGWESFKAKDGSDLTFETISEGTRFGPKQVVSQKCMKAAFTGRMWAIKELAKEISGNNSLSEDEEKNS